MSEQTFFEEMKRSFETVTVKDGEINTTEFLDAAEEVVKLFDKFNTIYFQPVQNDLTGNIKKVRDRQLSHPGDSETLQALVKNELAGGTYTAAQGLAWINRGLKFTACALRSNVSNPSEELITSFTSSYNQTLKKHHSIFARGGFLVAIGRIPSRGEFYGSLGPATQISNIKGQLQQWLTSLELCVNILDQDVEPLHKSIPSLKKGVW